MAADDLDERPDGLPANALFLGEIPLFRPLWSREALEKWQQRSPRAYARGFEQNAIDDSELMFPSWTKAVKAARTRRDSAGRVLRAGVRVEDILGMDRSRWHLDWEFFGGIDMSTEKRRGNVIATIAAEKAKAKAARRWAPVELVSGEWTHPQLLAHMVGVHRRWKWTGAFVEANAQQSEILRWAETTQSGQELVGGQGPRPAIYEGVDEFLKACKRDVVEGFTTSARKWDAYMGLPGIEIDLSMEAVAVPAGEWEDHPDDCLCGWCLLDDEMSGFTHTGPGASSRGTQSQGDHAMAVYFGWERMKSGSPQAERHAADVRSR